MSKGALWATRTQPAANSRNCGSTVSIVGAVATMASLMPVEHRDEGGDGLAGVDERLELAQNLAAAHLDGADLGDPGARAVGGAGGLQVDHAERDVAQRAAHSSNDCCSAHRDPGSVPAPAGTGVTVGTVGGDSVVVMSRRVGTATDRKPQARGNYPGPSRPPRCPGPPAPCGRA